MNREHAQRVVEHLEKQIPKLHEIAARITLHLTRIEMAWPYHGQSRCPYWHAMAWQAGSRVGVKYVSYQYAYKLTKFDAWRYLQWLDAGNEGRHTIALEALDRVEAP
jgi:hypothetical protein